MNAYEAKQEARRERLLRIADKFEREGNARFARAREMASVIPFGQPILVGHHSEGRDRRYRSRIDSNFRKSFEAQEKAAALKAKAFSVGSGGISSDDPEAVAKLEQELSTCEEAHNRMKAMNAAHAKFMKDPASLERSKLNDEDKELVQNYKPQYSWEPHPFAPYQLQNNNANIRRIKQRIEQLKAQVSRAEQSDETIQLSGFTATKAYSLNRLQLRFPGKPADAVRACLKSNGFRWSPTEGAWQRMLGGAEWIIDPKSHVRQQIELLST